MSLIKGIIGLGLGVGKLLLDSNDSNGGYYGSYTTEDLHSKLEDYMNELTKLTTEINSVHEELKRRSEELKYED